MRPPTVQSMRPLEPDPKPAGQYPAYRIVYGVQGEGRGHATRSLEVILALREQGYEVKVLSGGDALPVLRGAGLDVTEIPLIRYQYGPKGDLCPWRTICGNAPKAMGLWLRRGASFLGVLKAVRTFRPDLCITDFEPYLSRIARLSKLPLVAIDHQHFLTETLLPRQNRLSKAVLLGCYRMGTLLLGGQPDRIIASSFWHFPRRPGSRALLVGPFLGQGLKRMQPRPGERVVVYLKRAGYLQRLLPGLSAHPQVEFQIFSDWSRRPAGLSLPSHIQLHHVDRQAFLDALGSSHCLITTAGNQVIGEAVYFGKPVLAFPEPEVIEQELNAAALDRSGFGRGCALADLDGSTLTAFFRDIPLYRQRMQEFRVSLDGYDGRIPTLKLLRRLLRSHADPLAAPIKASPSRHLRPALTA